MKYLLLFVVLIVTQGCATVPQSGPGFWDRYEAAMDHFETCAVNVTVVAMLAPAKGVDIAQEDLCNKAWLENMGRRQ